MSITHSVLVADGSSDRMLIPILQKLLSELGQDLAFSDIIYSPVRADSLAKRVSLTVDKYPCDIVFVHRDAEGQPPDIRYDEIENVRSSLAEHNLVAVVPIRMTEAWLLVDADAIHAAVGNRGATVNLDLPSVKKIESCDAKAILDQALSKSVNLNSRRRRKFRPEEYRTRVAELLNSIEPLRKLSSFARFEADLKVVVDALRLTKCT
jgi:Domain of unknown function (DUF4276)